MKIISGGQPLARIINEPSLENSAELPLDELVKKTIQQLIKENPSGRYLSVKDFLKGHSIDEIVQKIKDNAKSPDDAELIIELVVNHADQVIERCNNKYNKTGNNKITFDQLLELKRKYPDKNIAELATYLIASTSEDENLAGLADKILAAPKRYTQQRPLSDVIEAQQYWIRVEKLEPKQIYDQTNKDYAEYFKEVDQKTEKYKEEQKLKKYKRLAFLELERKLSPDAQHNLAKTKLMEAIGAPA